MVNSNYGTVMTNEPTAVTTHGKVLGSNRYGVAAFLGIPYGGNVNGSNRFLPAKPSADWTGVRDCRKIGPLAMQLTASNPTFMMFQNYFTGGRPDVCGAPDEIYDENCLVVNVLTPGLDNKLRPVLVHIHGGGFDQGSGTVAIGGDKLCSEEDIVVVSLNHRLNLFGSLYLGAIDAQYADSGMVGMLDIVLALEWVRDNITAFGGDPAKVTIMGESGGCMKVNMLLAMKKAKGLFRAAIAESGSGPVGTMSTEAAAVMAEKYLRKLGIANNELAKLATLPAEAFLDAYKACMPEGVRFGPVGDNINLPYNETSAFIAPDISKDIPLMVSASEDEMASFIFINKADITWDHLRDALLGKIDGIFGMIGGKIGFTEENVDRVIEAFKATNTKNDSAKHLYMKINSLTGMLGAGAFWQALAKAEKEAAPVYHYMIRFDSPFPSDPASRYSWHTADLPLQFRSVFLPECEQLSKTMAHSWAAFVRTGNPSTETLSWPAFDTADRKVMIFDNICQIETDPYKKMRDVLPPVQLF